MRKTPETLAPLTQAEFQILLALVDSDRHGYGVMTEVRDRTDGEVVLGPGTLYGTLKRMTARGLVAEADRPDPDRTDERRKYYRLTDVGRRIASAEASRLAKIVRDARDKRLIPQRT